MINENFNDLNNSNIVFNLLENFNSSRIWGFELIDNNVTSSYVNYSISKNQITKIYEVFSDNIIKEVISTNFWDVMLVLIIFALLLFLGFIKFKH